MVDINNFACLVSLHVPTIYSTSNPIVLDFQTLLKFFKKNCQDSDMVAQAGGNCNKEIHIGVVTTMTVMM